METHLFSQVMENIQSLEEASLPFVWQHNDFGPWNIYRDRNDITVIDWEIGWGPGFDHVGPPLGDLFYLVTHWSYSARRLYTPADELRGFHELFLAPGSGDELVTAARESITEYLAALKIDQRFVRILLVNTWAERAVKRLDRRNLLGDLGESPRAGDQFVAYVNHLANQVYESQVCGGHEGRSNDRSFSDNVD
jgi:aminoglycoside phosphotransferase (APT) family kinase protein